MNFKIFSVLFVASCAAAFGQLAKCSWDANPELYVGGYRVLYGTNSQRYPFTNTVTGRLNTSVTVSNLPPGVLYFVVQSFAGELTSPNSYEILWTNAPTVVPVPPSAPRGFKLSANVQAGASPFGPWTNLADVNIPMPPMPTNQTASFYRSTLLLKELP